MRTSLALICVISLSACSYLPSWMGGAEKEIKRLPGERSEILPAATEFEADATAKQAAFNIPPASENAEWAQHTGQFSAAAANLSVKGAFADRKSATIGEGDSFEHPLVPRPVVADGKVFVVDASGHISAHGIDNIDKILWVSAALVNDRESPVMGGGLAFDKGKLFATSGLGIIAAIDATNGKEIWRNNIGIPFRSAPKINGDKVFAITLDNQTFALDIANGKIIWSHRGINETAGLMNTVSPSIAGDRLIAPYSSGELYAVALSDGSEAWRESPSQARRTQAAAIFSGIGGDPVVDDTVIFTVSNGGGFSVINALSGDHLWDKPFAAINTPWVVGDYVYLLASDNVLYCMLKYDGRVRWKTTLKSYEDEKRRLYPITWRGPIMVNDKILVTSSNGQMKLFAGSDGAEISTIDIPDDVFTAPIAAAGHVFLVTKDAKLYSYP